MGTRGDDRSLRANAEAIRQDQSRPLAFLRTPALEFCFQTAFDAFAVGRALEAFPANQNEVGTTRLYDHGREGVFHPLLWGERFEIPSAGAAAQQASTAKKAVPRRERNRPMPRCPGIIGGGDSHGIWKRRVALAFGSAAPHRNTARIVLASLSMYPRERPLAMPGAFYRLAISGLSECVDLSIEVLDLLVSTTLWREQRQPVRVTLIEKPLLHPRRLIVRQPLLYHCRIAAPAAFPA
jgi:hypothetical protein